MTSSCPENAGAKKVTDKPKEALFRAQRLCPANTQFKNSARAMEYLNQVFNAHGALKLSFDRFDPDDVVKRVLARDAVWLANFVAVWLDEHLLSAQVRRSLQDSPGTMCQSLPTLFIAMDIGHLITFEEYRNCNFFCKLLLLNFYCKEAILEGSFNTLTTFAKHIVREYHRSGPGYANRFLSTSQSLRTMLLSMQHHPLFNWKKPHDLEKAKALLRRLPGDDIRRFVIPHIPMFRADIYSMLYCDMRVVGTEAYLDVLLACRTRRNTISSMHCPFHDRQRRFQVAPYGSSSVDRDVLPLSVEFVPREHSTVDHTHLHMYADVNPCWTCKDAVELSKMRCIVSQEEFEMNFLAITGMDLRRMKLREHGFVIAGGSLVLSLLPLLPPDATLEQRRTYYHAHYPTADIDIFPYATPTPLRPAANDPPKFNRFLKHLHDDVFGGEDMLVTSSQRLITVVRRSTHVVIQIPYGDWREPLDVVENADMDCAGVYYSDHTGVRMTLRAHLAFTHRMNVTSQAMWCSRGSPAYEGRLCRYSQRGFSVVDRYVPQANIAALDAHIDRWRETLQPNENSSDDVLRGAARVRAIARGVLEAEVYHPSSMCLTGEDAQTQTNNDNIQYVLDGVVGRRVDAASVDDDSYGRQNQIKSKNSFPFSFVATV